MVGVENDVAFPVWRNILRADDQDPCIELQDIAKTRHWLGGLRESV